MITNEKAIEIAKKLLTDINFWAENVGKPSAKLVIGEDLKYFGYKDNPFWLVSFIYGEEDYGEDVARVYIDVDYETGEVDESVTNRSGSIEIKLDVANNKYVRIK